MTNIPFLEMPLLIGFLAAEILILIVLLDTIKEYSDSKHTYPQLVVAVLMVLLLLASVAVVTYAICAVASHKPILGSY